MSPTPVLVRSSNAAALARIRLTNGAPHLPYGSGETKGELPLRGQSEREALRVCLSTQLANDATHLPTVRQAARKYCCAVRRDARKSVPTLLHATPAPTWRGTPYSGFLWNCGRPEYLQSSFTHVRLVEEQIFVFKIRRW